MANEKLERLHAEFDAAKAEYEKVGVAFLVGSTKSEQVTARYNAARDALDFEYRRFQFGVPVPPPQSPSKVAVFRTAFEIYTRGRLLGQGGTGKVYEASDEEGGKFAVKCLSPANLTSERSRRFKNEIRLCSKIGHKNLVPTLDSGVSEEGPFYVMPFYASNLRQLMKAGVEPSKVIPLFSQLLDGLEAVHEAGVWHRDIKPENILYDPDSDLLAIADFGIAHIAEPLLHTLIETAPGDRLANFYYAAPEQRQTKRAVDKNADIYAAGLILNEMFTFEMLAGTEYRRIVAVNPEYGFLDAIVDRMARQDPSQRPSISEIREALRGNSSSEESPRGEKRTPTVPVRVTVPNPTEAMIGRLRGLHRDGARLQITPIFPVRCASDEFRITDVQSDFTQFEKLGSGHHITIPMGRIREILPIDPRTKSFVVTLNGRLQWISINQSWRFFLELPSDAGSPIGLGKSSAAQDQRRIDVEHLLRSRGTNTWLIDTRHLLNALAEGRQVVYDEDGRYFQVPSGPNSLVLVASGP